jgi:hypothetical protein
VSGADGGAARERRAAVAWAAELAAAPSVAVVSSAPGLYVEVAAAVRLALGEGTVIACYASFSAGLAGLLLAPPDLAVFDIDCGEAVRLLGRLRAEPALARTRPLGVRGREPLLRRALAVRVGALYRGGRSPGAARRRQL